MAHEIIDFHTHPWVRPEDNICNYRELMVGDPIATFRRDLERCGITRAAGSVIPMGMNQTPEEQLCQLRLSNDYALTVREEVGDFYIPGMMIHPAFVRESCEEIERMHARGVRLVGELVPYLCGWGPVGYVHEGMDEILALIGEYGMVVNFHSMGAREDEYAMVKNHPDVVFVAAHPGEKPSYLRHLEWLEELPNYHLDLSGTGLFRYEMLAYGVGRVGAERFLFGSDYPVCSPGMNVGGVEYEPITDRERELIFAGNARRLLGL